MQKAPHGGGALRSVGSGALFRLLDEAQIGQLDVDVAELRLAVLGRDRERKDHVLARHPVRGGGEGRAVGHLDRVERAQHLGEVAAHRHRIDHHQADLLVGPDDEDGAHGRGMRRGASVGQIGLGRQHVIELRHGQRGVVDDREGRRRAGIGGDVGLPLLVFLDGVDRDAHHLGVALRPFIGELRDGAELGGADRGEILRMREQDGVAVADPVVEADLALGGVGGEVGGDVVDAQSHVGLPG
ncbi:hypothetical protein SDC9_06327 [bioreactor metagenome]|uniref:Uncharacterized protein n=1 Tax=bioreactor metagenome TaxID=1076179 RepID=A0A644T1I1_9ZZZZ